MHYWHALHSYYSLTDCTSLIWYIGDNTFIGKIASLAGSTEVVKSTLQVGLIGWKMGHTSALATANAIIICNCVNTNHTSSIKWRLKCSGLQGSSVLVDSSWESVSLRLDLGENLIQWSREWLTILDQTYPRNLVDLCYIVDLYEHIDLRYELDPCWSCRILATVVCM